MLALFVAIGLEVREARSEDYTIRVYLPALTDHSGPAFEGRDLREAHYGYGGEFERVYGDYGAGVAAWKGMDSVDGEMGLVGIYGSWHITDWLHLRAGGMYMDHFLYEGFAPLVAPAVQVPITDSIFFGVTGTYIPDWAMPVDGEIAVVYPFVGVRF
jgi:hypothetical protein